MSWSDPAYESVARLFEERTGVLFPPGSRPRAELGVRRALARAGHDDLKRYRVQVARDHALFDDLVTELTVGETYFFREPDQFAFLRQTILPSLRERNGGGLVRAWSAGCASGEEAYSLAMAFTAEGLAGDSHVLATDLSRAALARARQGIYSEWSLRGEGADAARPYLEEAGERYRVADRIRRLVALEHLNLALDVYPSFVTGTWGVDLIFCRNVLIYFDREAVGLVALRLFNSLAEGGWLVTGSSDPPIGGEAPFETVVTDHGLFYRRPFVGTRVKTRDDAAVNAGLSPGGDGPGHVPLAPEVSSRGLEPGQPADDIPGSVRNISTIANLDVEQAERTCAAAIVRYPFSAELHYLRAVLLLGLERAGEAAAAARRVIYLDRTLAAGHFLLGSILQQEGDGAGARRAYRNARDLASARPPGEDLPLAEGETAGQLADRAARQLARLDAHPEIRP
ncbi:MAG: protein-glutamate O-methyltransferase CheR [Isosphaeraceae bacterium]|nr:protein-glutamate O-methyltransferase CheR [Isosphaeraceae bacterium]